MPDDRSKFTVRMSKSDLATLDAARVKHGFPTRSSFLAAAGLAYGKTQDFDEPMRRLAQICFCLNRLQNSDTKPIPRDAVQSLVREVKGAMRAVRKEMSR